MALIFYPLVWVIIKIKDLIWRRVLNAIKYSHKDSNVVVYTVSKRAFLWCVILSAYASIEEHVVDRSTDFGTSLVLGLNVWILGIFVLTNLVFIKDFKKNLLFNNKMLLIVTLVATPIGFIVSIAGQ